MEIRTQANAAFKEIDMHGPNPTEDGLVVAETANENSAFPLNQLAYFVGWGGDEAIALTSEAIHRFLGANLTGKRVLEIGAGDGRMSCLFALLGAEVVGVDVAPDFEDAAYREAGRWAVQSRTSFIRYSGDPSILENNAFDIVFTKSVLLLVPKLDEFLNSLLPKIRPGGRVVFVENAYRNLLDLLARRLVHLIRRQYSLRIPVYMNRERLQQISSVLEMTYLRHRKCSPFRSRSSGWYLVCATKPRVNEMEAH